MRHTLMISVAALALAAATSSVALAQNNGPTGTSAPAGTAAPAANTGTPGAAQSQPSEKQKSTQQAPANGKSAPMQQGQAQPGTPKNNAANEPERGTKPGANGNERDRTRSGTNEHERGTKSGANGNERDRARSGTNDDQRGTKSGANGNERDRTRSGANENERGTKSGATENERDRTRSGANANERGTKSGAAERPMTSKNVSLSTEQKTTIRSTVLTSSAPRVTNVNFDVKVGVVVPRRIRVAPLPVSLVEIEPTWRGYMYFVRGDEIIIVEPRTLRIVAVLEV